MDVSPLPCTATQHAKDGNIICEAMVIFWSAAAARLLQWMLQLARYCISLKAAMEWACVWGGVLKDGPIVTWSRVSLRSWDAQNYAPPVELEDAEDCGRDTNISALPLLAKSYSFQSMRNEKSDTGMKCFRGPPSYLNDLRNPTSWDVGIVKDTRRSIASNCQ